MSKLNEALRRPPGATWCLGRSLRTAVLGLAWALAGVVSAQESQELQEVQARAVDADSTAAEAPVDGARIAEWLTSQPPVQLGAEDVRMLWRVLGTGRYEVPDGDAWVERKVNARDRKRLESFLESACSLGTARSAADGLSVGEEDDGTLAAALTSLGNKGDERDVARLLALATPAGESPETIRVVAQVRVAFAHALRKLAARHPDELEALSNAFERAHTSLLSGIVEALAEVPSIDAIERLEECLHQLPELDPFVLSRLANVASRVWQRPDERVLQSVRRLLTSDDARLRREAIRAAGALVDYDAIPDLIRELESQDPNVTRSAHRALESITGVPLPPKASRWSDWYDEQLHWSRTRSMELLGQLQQGGAAFVAQGFREVSAHRLYREDLARGVAACLDREEADLVAMACSVLAHLGSPAAVSDLIECLDHPSPKVSMAALAALRDVTGMDLGPDRSAWLGLRR